MNITKELSVFNRVTFVESSHTYLIDGKITKSGSVTQLLKKFKKPFEKELMAARVAKKQRVSTEEILAQWNAGSLYSTTLGSILHKYIENYYCNKKAKIDIDYTGLVVEQKQQIISTLPRLINQFHDFYKDYSNLLCVRNELVLGDMDGSGVCGMSDMLCHNVDTDKLEILDFKTNKKMQESSPYGSLFYPFDDMSAGEINEYTIQLNVYKYFIEEYTNIKIDKLKIVWFNTINDTYKIFELKDIQDKIRKMFDDLQSNKLFEC